ncbi:MAG: hypothetical protein ACXWMV_12425 [Syntrophales bacterium]
MARIETCIVAGPPVAKPHRNWSPLRSKGDRWPGGQLADMEKTASELSIMYESGEGKLTALFPP